jgi:uncharacterized protein (DUF488 family)
MEIYSIGFTKKSASQFFGALKAHGIERLLDVRLNNTSQLAGFAKQGDLPYFLEEICGARYEHEPLLAPTQEILDEYKKRKGSWEVYTKAYLTLIRSRKVEAEVPKEGFEKKTVLLCSEAAPDRCHRKLALEYLQQHWGGVVIHHL